MKLILPILFLLVLSSCTKDTDQLRQASTAPQITQVEFFPVYGGSSGSICFKVTLNITAPVTKVNLIKYNNYLICYTVNNPESKTYTMYHHSEYPTHAQSIFYFFEFHMADGTIISGEKFQVY